MVVFVLQESSNEAQLEPLDKHYCARHVVHNGYVFVTISRDCFFTEKELKDFMHTCSVGKMGKKGFCYAMYKEGYLRDANGCAISNNRDAVCAYQRLE
ncbi:MAG: hypothetical protein EB830_05320 [Nitrosopumilus sp. H13]|nr:MAG: hypothetical protein EB830_05320 [Nitrosopumilus sp. H13]